MTLIADRYRVIRRLGSGGAGTVMLAEDQKLGRQVAIKRFYGDDPDLTRRFDREARLGASLRHPGFVSVYDALTTDDGVFLVMEHVAGESLADVIARGPMPAERAIEILRPLAEALDHAHSHGVIHRDVKPSNVLIRTDGVVKLADLGIATSEKHTRITRTGVVVGTVAYMAPEQLDGRHVTPAADVFALASLGYEMLSGRPARPGETPMEIMRQIVDRPPPDLREARPGTGAEVADVLRRGMARDPDERQPSARVLVDELERALGREREALAERPARAAVATAPMPARGDRSQVEARSEPARAGAPSQSSRRWLAAGAAVLVVGAALLGIVLLAGDGGDGGSGSPDEGGREVAADGAEDEPSEGTEPSGGAAPGEAGETVRSFYELAAAGDYDAAWALAGGSFRSQLQGFDSFQAQFSSLESISFERLETLSESEDAATVALETTAVHTDRTDRCAGEASLAAPATGEWRIERIDVDCTS